MSWDLSYDYTLSHGQHLRGGVYTLDGTDQAELNITWNYLWFYYKAIDIKEGLRVLDGMPAYQVIDMLTSAIEFIGDSPRHNDYWQPTPGNACRALRDLRALSRMVPPETILHVR